MNKTSEIREIESLLGITNNIYNEQQLINNIPKNQGEYGQKKRIKP